MGLREVLTTASSRAEEQRSLLTVSSAADLVHDAVDVELGEGGWARPRRFSASQLQALSSCSAWHPGLFRQMALATAGVCVRFATDANEVALAVLADDEPRGTAAVLRAVDAGAARAPHDGISAVVDGQRVGCALPHVFSRSMPWFEHPGPVGIASFRLLDSKDEPGNGIVALPGLGRRREVCLWLPCLRGCRVRELWTDGTFVEPLPARERLLVVGDSLGQGFCCDDPSLAWPALLAEDLGADLLNQSVGGQVFQPSALSGAPREGVTRVVVELGTNYRWERCCASEVKRDVGAFLAEADRLWPEVPTFVVTPPWHDEARVPARPGSCYDWVRGILEQAVDGHPSARLVDGLDLVDHDPALLPDGEHLGAAAHRQMARRLRAALRRPRERQASARSGGKAGRKPKRG